MLKNRGVEKYHNHICEMAERGRGPGTAAEAGEGGSGGGRVERKGRSG